MVDVASAFLATASVPVMSTKPVQQGRFVTAINENFARSTREVSQLVASCMENGSHSSEMMRTVRLHNAVT
jgi:hypothetical protein